MKMHKSSHKDCSNKFEYTGILKEGMDCPQCIFEGKKGKDVGILRMKGSPWASVVYFKCTKYNYNQYGYDNIAIAIGIF